MSQDQIRIAAFLEMMSAERGASLNTLDAYRRDLSDASEFLCGALVSAKQSEIAAYMADLGARGLAATTAARRLSAIKRFFRFLFEERDRRDNPTSQIDGPKTRRDVPDVLSREEMAHLLSCCGEDLRLTCLVELLYGAGLRVSELVSLPIGALPRRKQLRWETREIIVRGKGGKERLCPLGQPALNAIRDWLDVREESLPKSEAARKRSQNYVFPSRGKSGHLTHDTNLYPCADR